MTLVTSNLKHTQQCSLFVRDTYVCHVCMLSPSVFYDSATLWTVAHQAMGFSREEDWSGLPFLSLENLPDPGSNPHLLGLLHCSRILYLLSHGGSPTYMC